MNDYIDETIYRRTRIIRYAEGQARLLVDRLKRLNNAIAKKLLKIEVLETKALFREARTIVREYCIVDKQKAFNYIQKELRGFIKEQSRFIYGVSPVKLKRVKPDKVLRDINFTAFSDTETIQSFIDTVYNRIYKLYNGQLTIAYKLKTPLKDMLANILGKEGL
jgi:hypothetical protein